MGAPRRACVTVCVCVCVARGCVAGLELNMSRNLVDGSVAVAPWLAQHDESGLID